VFEEPYLPNLMHANKFWLMGSSLLPLTVTTAQVLGCLFETYPQHLCSGHLEWPAGRSSVLARHLILASTRHLSSVSWKVERDFKNH